MRIISRRVNIYAQRFICKLKTVNVASSGFGLFWFSPTGDTLHYRFVSDMSNTEWGYKFTVTGGHRGRFQTGQSLTRSNNVVLFSFHSLGCF